MESKPVSSNLSSRHFCLFLHDWRETVLLWMTWRVGFFCFFESRSCYSLFSFCLLFLPSSMTQEWVKRMWFSLFFEMSFASHEKRTIRDHTLILTSCLKFILSFQEWRRMTSTSFMTRREQESLFQFFLFTQGSRVKLFFFLLFHTLDHNHRCCLLLSENKFSLRSLSSVLREREKERREQRRRRRREGSRFSWRLKRVK